ncbi:acyltransferase family protein [Glycomyces salinus]|uniref:acyltransferase family protein n=1 Tax=Glycomyces salinus TaxID=980294 RepID=UPI0018EB4103|nr:acyltransferase family protein [Glycomyces salinus]
MPLTEAARSTSRRDDSAPDRTRPDHWRPDIEGLRALAVVMVIAAHIQFFYSEGGFVGVDVFFVISGFLITSLLLREIERTGRVSLTKFYARRAVRLLPAAATVLVATLVAAWLWLPRTRLGDIAADTAAAALNVVNFRLASEGTDYLNADVDPSPLQHFWSLAVEEQFYLVWPLMLLAVAVVCGRLWGGRFARRYPLYRRRITVIAIVLAAVAAVSFFLSVTRSAEDPVWSYFGIHTRAWELAAGAFVAVLANRIRRTVPAAAAAVASWIGLAALVGSVFLIDEATAFPGYAAVLPVAGTAVVIAAGCVPHRFGAGTLLGIAPAQYLGKISYGLYLWHWPIVMIAPVALGVEPRLRYMVPLMGLAFLLSVAMFHLIENPVRTRRPLVQVPSRALALGGALMVCALAASFVAVTQPVTDGDGTEAAEITGDETTVWQLLGESSEIDSVPANLTPSLEDAREDEPSMYDKGCMVARSATDLVDECWFGDPEGDKTVVLYGDSHAAQWFPAFNQLAQASGWRMLVLTKANCSVPEVREHDPKLNHEYTECYDWKGNALAEIEEVDPDLVVAASYDDKDLIADDPDQAWVDGWVEAVEDLRSRTDEVYYLADTPVAAEDVPDCLAEHPDDATECVNELDDAVLYPDRREDLQDAVSEAGAHVVDPIPWICDTETGRCPVVVGNLLVYRDSNHLAARFVAELTPQIATAFPLEELPREDEEAG